MFRRCHVFHQGIANVFKCVSWAQTRLMKSEKWHFVAFQVKETSSFTFSAHFHPVSSLTQTPFHPHLPLSQATATRTPREEQGINARTHLWLRYQAQGSHRVRAARCVHVKRDVQMHAWSFARDMLDVFYQGALGNQGDFLEEDLKLIWVCYEGFYDASKQTKQTSRDSFSRIGVVLLLFEQTKQTSREPFPKANISCLWKYILSNSEFLCKVFQCD